MGWIDSTSNSSSVPGRRKPSWAGGLSWMTPRLPPPSSHQALLNHSTHHNNEEGALCPAPLERETNSNSAFLHDSGLAGNEKGG